MKIIDFIYVIIIGVVNIIDFIDVIIIRGVVNVIRFDDYIYN